jgi:antitoxin CptB
MSEKSKLLWRCRRGVKELDVVFTKFVDSSYDGLNEQQKQAFSKLLDIEDPVILSYMLRQTVPNDAEMAGIVEMVRSNV